MKRPIYSFSCAQGFLTDTEGTVRDIADNLEKAALYLVNANWNDKKREELIYNMQCAVTDALDFLSLITVVKD